MHHWNQNNQVREHFSQQTQVSEPIQPAVVPPPGFPFPAHAAQHMAHAPPEVVEHQQHVSKQAQSQSHVPDATSELNRQLKHANEDLKIHHQNVKSEFEEAAKTTQELEHDIVHLETTTKALKSDHKSLQLRHEKVCADLRSVKHERDHFLTENNQLSVALKSAKRDLKNSLENL